MARHGIPRPINSRKRAESRDWRVLTGSKNARSRAHIAGTHCPPADSPSLAERRATGSRNGGAAGSAAPRADGLWRRIRRSPARALFGEEEARETLTRAETVLARVEQLVHEATDDN